VTGGSAGNDSDAKSPSDAKVVGTRTEADLTRPETEDPEHKDLQMVLGDRTVQMRWDQDMGYVVTGEKDASGQMQPYDDARYREVNAGQLEKNGGGRIPAPTSEHPEYYQPPTGDSSLIYRYDPDTKKDVIVGYRTEGDRHYFQSQATMDAVNAQAEAGHAQPPQRPPTPSGEDIPPKSEFVDGHVSMHGPATNGDGKTYVWRWDGSAGRYCAVAESNDSGASYSWYSKDQYKSHNSGENAPVMQATPIAAPSADPSHGETTEEGSTQVRFDEDPDGGSDGKSREVWGTPVYVVDSNTGHQVMVGVKEQVKEGEEGTTHYFNDQQMASYNDVQQTSGGSTYYVAKPTSSVANEDKQEDDVVAEDYSDLSGGA
jgi:hypothetical protein